MRKNKGNQPSVGRERESEPDLGLDFEITDFCAEDDFWLAFPIDEETEPLPDEGDFWIEPD